MSLTPRLVAIQGIGLSPIAMAVQGLYPVPDATAAGASPIRLPFGQWPHFHVPHRRPRNRRQDDILFL